MRSESLPMAKGYGEARPHGGGNGGQDTTGHEVGEKLKAAWAVAVLLVSGLFALVTAILIAWPALAYIAAKFFD